MPHNATDMEALVEALQAFTLTTQRMEEAYRLLETRLLELDQELAAKNRELAFTSEYLGNLLESMSDGVIAIDTAGAITRFNRGAATILGYAADEVHGRLFHEVFGRDFASPRTPGAMELRAKSGRRVPVSERDSTIAGSDGQRLGSVKTFQDLSELTALREQVRQIDRLAAIGEMAASVAHEIRNPLGGIRGFATFLKEDLGKNDPRCRLVDKILSGAESLDRVVNELLEYTRPVVLTLSPVPCAGLIASAIEYAKCDPARVTIISQVDPALKILADARQVRQVFLNILLNAIQSISGPGEIEITADADDSYVRVAFKDSGCGMDQEQLSRIFSPFFTTKEKGTGLGLAICAKIVEGHGGALDAQSAPGNGSTITVRLPRTE